MKTFNLEAVKNAHKKVTEKKEYKYKKHLIDAIFWEFFFEGYANISEKEITKYIHSL